MYEDETAKAKDLAFKEDMEALHLLCDNQVESFMDMWNKNKDFRKDYIRCNKISTLKRLGTLDGRSAGPGEDRSLLLQRELERASTPLAWGKRNSKTVVSTLQQEKLVKCHGYDEKELGYESRKVASKGTTDKISGNKDKQVKEEDLARKREEFSREAEAKSEELRSREAATKAEEMRQREDASMLRENRRLDEIAKAKAAEVRKQKNVEKAQARLELMARKEKEIEDKKRQKKEKKKERKAAAEEARNRGVESRSSYPIAEMVTSESIKEPEIEENTIALPKGPHKPPLFGKQTKKMSVPQILRNKRKREMYRWMGLFAFVVLVIFLLVTFIIY